MQTFKKLGVAAGILPVLTQLGYEMPSPIQTETIPLLLKGRDVLAQAQTGTGKTAAFALPILSNLNLKLRSPQALILAPTRELAIQVAESLHAYAKGLEGFQVLPVYGGQEFRRQLEPLRRGVHVIVGTPGRIMDHMRRGSLKLNTIKTVVLDEADEMLKMGFIDDVDLILSQVPKPHQTALFSATLPASIKNIAHEHLINPEHVLIKSNTATVDSITQLAMMVNKNNKIEALTRFLEVEDYDAMMIFAGTKIATIEVAEKLEARGYAVSAINGDMKQSERERVIKSLKERKLDLIVATEVAARGLDVDRVSHVVNYDIPYDPESYVHRVGRTGRAGRQGTSLLLVTPREQRMLKLIEKTTRHPIKMITPPSVSKVAEKRQKALAMEIISTIEKEELSQYRQFIKTILHEQECDELDIAAALAYLKQPIRDMEELKPLNFIESPEGRGNRKRHSNAGGNRNFSKGSKGPKGSKDSKGFKDGKGFKEGKSFKDAKESKGAKEFKGVKDKVKPKKTSYKKKS